jgi:trehalose 6-phosphate synthase
MAGGVSPALTRLMADDGSNHKWWHLDENTIKYSNSAGTAHARQCLPKALMEGHYRYCNEFLWPIMHDMSEFATYRSEDRALYERFSRIFAREIVAGNSRHPGSTLFVQDYQLALLPKELQRMDGPACGIFWHIPWPKSVPQEFLHALVDVAKSMLSAEFVGFHTQEYCSNFFNFVAKNIPGTKVSMRERTIVREPRAHMNPAPSFQSNSRIHLAERRSHLVRSTKVIAAPLGLDVDHWQKIARQQSNTHMHPSLINTNFILSVDRADYTKGVVPRLESIAHFFNDHPEMIGRITFAQLCTRTRPGIDAFDNNWYNIQRLIKDINSRFSNQDWQPILNLKGPLKPAELSLLYANASMMLVNPVRDGLNLTAKEFIACQSGRPGVLALSPHCGAYEELGEWAVDANPFEPTQMSQSIFEALQLPEEEKRSRLIAMRTRLKENTLTHWCNQFRDLLEPAAKLDEAIEAAF